MHSTRASPAPSSGPTPRVIFFDAEGTLWVPRPGKTFADFWAEPTDARARHVFELAPGCLETLRTLKKQGVRRVVVSKHNETILPGLLDLFGLSPYFEDVLINGDKGVRVRDWLAKERIRKRDALMVGDRVDLDIDPMVREGIPALLVDRPENRGEGHERIGGLAELAGLKKERVVKA